MNKLTVIQSIIDELDAGVYLEIGVQKAKNFYKVKAPFKIAVDPAFRLKLKRKIWYLKDIKKNHFFETTSDKFFAEHAPAVLKNGQIDVAFIDGLHTYEQSYKDFENCLQYLSPTGVILFHDCNPATKEAGEPVSSPREMKEKYPDKPTWEWNGDVWKSIVRLRALNPGFEVFTLDCDYGVGVVRKGVAQSSLSYSEADIESMTYDDLEANRVEFLNLKQPDYLWDFLKRL